MYSLILAHHEGLDNTDYVKINRKQLLEYVVDILFAYAKNKDGTYFGGRLSQEGYLRLKMVLSSRPTREFHGVWPVMEAYRNYILLSKEVQQEKVIEALKAFATSPELIRAAAAIQADDPLALDEFFQESPNLAEVTSDQGQNLLHFASMLDRGGLVTKLVSEYHMDPFVRDLNHTTPLELALHLGNVRAAQAIMYYVIREEGFVLPSKKLDILGCMNKHIVESSGTMMRTMLTWTHLIKDERVFTEEGVRQIMLNELMQKAALNGNWIAFCHLLDAGADPNYRRPGKEGQDVLTSTVILNQPIMAAVLLALGANPDGNPGPQSFPPLHHAAVGSGYNHDALKTKKDAIYQLGDQSSHVITFQGLYPCHSADLQQFSIHVLLAYGADLEIREESGRTPFSGSVITSRYNVQAKFLLERKYPADIDAPDLTGSTALHFAAKGKDLQRLDFLIRYGANLEVKDLRGRTPLAVAAGFANIRICERLVGAGANIGARDANGNNCLELALHSEKLTRYFLGVLRYCPDEKRNCILNNRDHQSRSIIHVAVTSTSNKRVPASVLQLLIDEGIKPLTRDAIGYTPLHWVIAIGDPRNPSDLSRQHAEVLLRHRESQPLLLHPPDDVLGLPIGHFLALYRRIDLIDLVQKYLLLHFVVFANELRGTLVKLTMMELLDMVKDPESNYPTKLIEIMMKMSAHRAPMFHPDRVISEYRGLERISNTRKLALHGLPETKQLEWDYFANGEFVETFTSRRAFIIDGHGRPRGIKLFTEFSDDELNPRVWVYDEAGSCHGVLGNANDILADSEKENEGWTQEELKSIGEMLMKTFKESGVVADDTSEPTERSTELAKADEGSKKKKAWKGDPLYKAIQTPEQREDGEWIWPDNGCEVSGMEALEAEILGDLRNPTDDIVYLETPMYS
jgi:ankyrin repeat protein